MTYAPHMVANPQHITTNVLHTTTKAYNIINSTYNDRRTASIKKSTANKGNCTVYSEVN